MATRAPAVAGQFYQADGTQLSHTVDALLEACNASNGNTPRALIVPHAGYQYSGHTAAEAYKLLRPVAQDIERVILLGPAHRVYLQSMALPSVEAFNTPLGDIPLHRQTMDTLAALPGVTISDEAHREEHSLEVQLPFLQRVLGEFSLVPIVVGQCPAEQVAHAIDAVWPAAKTLLLVSTDLSHFHKYEQARQLDQMTCDRVLAGQTNLRGEDACGANALNGLLCSQSMKSMSIELVSLCNSGDTAGDRNRVVGYGAFAVY